MLKTILIPINDSKLVHKQLKKIAHLGDLVDSTVYLVFVSEPFLPDIYSESTISRYYMSIEDYKQSCEAYVDMIFRKAKKILGDAVTCRTLHVYDEDIAKGILQAAKKVKADVIMMASHRYSGVKSVILGNNVHKVIVNSKFPVLVL